MKNYLWIIIIGIIATISLLFFILSISRDTYLIKKLKLPKKNLSLNFLLLVGVLADLGVIAYIFIGLKNQLNIFG